MQLGQLIHQVGQESRKLIALCTDHEVGCIKPMGWMGLTENGNVGFCIVGSFYRYFFKQVIKGFL